jgi:alpha-galactosidase
MGWNSYDCFGYAVTEDQVRANADYMARSLKAFGWNYVVIDYVWSCPKLGLDVPAQNASFQPRLAMDEFGRLVPDPSRFPSSANGKGFKPLADWLHSKGLKFGIHLMRGIPRQAVALRSPIEGSKSTALDAANSKSPCPWLNHMWGMNMANPAGQEYLDSIFRLYAAWGVDFVKVDDLSNAYSAAEVEGYRKAITRSKRSIVLSLSPGPTPLDKAEHVRKYANMWRLLGDLWDNWDQLDNAFDSIASWNPFRGTDHWPDPDMLPLGRLRVYGPSTGPPNSASRFTQDEAKTLMSLWCIARCPLMFGGNLPQTDPFTLSLLTNSEALAINQKSSNNRPIAGGEHPIWTADSFNNHEKYLAIFNRSDQASLVTVRLSDIGVESCSTIDVWSRHRMSLTHGTLDEMVPAHGVRLLVLDVRSRVPITTPENDKPNPSGASYEAESPANTLLGETKVDSDFVNGKCSGGKLVRNIGSKPGNILRFNHVVAKDNTGYYVVTIVYMSAEKRRMYVRVNQGDPVYHTFYSTGGWDGRYLGWTQVTVPLISGDNTIELGNPTAWGVDVDRIIVRHAP